MNLSQSESAGGPDLSIIVPVVERHGDLRRLFEEYAEAVSRLDKTAEFIFVVDNRQSEAIPTLRELQEGADHEVILVSLAGSFGESTALMVGLDQARAPIIVTLASYFQVEPQGLAEAWALIEDGYDLIVGRRYPRTDPVFNRAQTAVFHWIVRKATGSDFHDISCGFRMMTRAVAEELNVYGGLHRFIPVLAMKMGFKVEELPLAQRKEDLQTRYYGAALYVKRLLDVLTVFFLLKFTKRPLRFFGLVGLGLTIVGGLITGYLGLYRILQFGPIGDRPLLLLGVLLIVLGIQTLSIGLLGEIIIFTHASKQRDYRIARVIQQRGGALEAAEPSG